jgi:hypothetical protein
LTRPFKQHFHQPSRPLSTATNEQQYSRTNNFALPQTEDVSISGFNNKPLKQITLSRPIQEEISQQPAINYMPIQHSTKAPPTMKLSQVRND